MLSEFFLKSARILLLPFAFVYWFAIAIRNLFYDLKIFRSASFGLPVICVGNLSVGGTGKSPMVEYLIGNLQDGYKVATLSRGYKRRTVGYALADSDSTALEIGDEPMQFHIKFPDISVAVGEDRVVAIPELLHDKPGTQVIILDDAFQHRAIKAGLNILLTDYNNLFTRDFYLPTGDLRDTKSSYKRADIIIVTKCPDAIDENEKTKIRNEISPLSNQYLFFTSFEYGEPYHILTKEKTSLTESKEVLLVSGIANPKPLKKWLEEKSKAYYMMPYPDHHIFTVDDLQEIKKRFEKMDAKDKMILSTEKDAVRLTKFKNDLAGLPLYIVPIRHRFLFDETQRFNDIVINFIKNFKQQEQQ